MSTTRVPQVVVCALIRNGNKYLLSQRSDTDPDSFGRNLWQIPGGGLNLEETLTQCAVREIKEELGLDITVEKFLCVEEEIRANKWHGVLIFYLCSVDPTQKIILNEESADSGWFTVEEASKLPSFKETEKVIRLAESVLN